MVPSAPGRRWYTAASQTRCSAPPEIEVRTRPSGPKNATERLSGAEKGLTARGELPSGRAPKSSSERSSSFPPSVSPRIAITWPSGEIAAFATSLKCRPRSRKRRARASSASAARPQRQRCGRTRWRRRAQPHRDCATPSCCGAAGAGPCVFSGAGAERASSSSMRTSPMSRRRRVGSFSRQRRSRRRSAARRAGRQRAPVGLAREHGRDHVGDRLAREQPARR